MHYNNSLPLLKNVKLKPIKIRRNDKDLSDPSKQGNGGGWFYVNKGGFPLDNLTWERMWSFASKQHPFGLNIREQAENECISEIPVAKAPISSSSQISINSKLDLIQNYFKTLQYNHTGTQFFSIKKHQPLYLLMETAKEIISESLPIKCLEAVIVALYLTNNYEGLDRFSIGFKSRLNGCTHRHVVLGLHFNQRFGSLGMSRRDDLMNKPLKFHTLTDLILDFKSCYEKYSHSLLRVKIGFTIPHNLFTYESIQWGVVSINLEKQDIDSVTREIEKASRNIRRASKWTTNIVYNPSPTIKKKKLTNKNEKQ